jgi:prepilin-type processing-associated H-X9-DG protein
MWRVEHVIGLVMLLGLNAHAQGQPDQQLERLIEQLESQDEEASVEAGWRIGLLGEAGAPAVPRLVRLLGSGRDPVACLAMRVLLRIGAPAAPALAESALDSDDWTDPQPRLAAWLLQAMGAEALLAMLEAMGPNDAVPVWYREYVRLLAKRGEPVGAAVQEFSSWLDAPAGARRALGAELLGLMGPAAESAVEHLAARLDDDEADVRVQAAEALRQIGRTSPAAIETLESRTRRERDPRALLHIGWALCDLGRTEAGARAFWRSMEVTRAPWGDMPPERGGDYGAQAERFLAELGADVLPMLFRRLAAEDEATRDTALGVLRQMDELPDDAVSVPSEIVALLDHDSPEVRLSAVRALGFLGESGADMLIECLEHEDRLIRETALEALHNTLPGISYAVESCLPGLRSEELEEQFRAIRCIDGNLMWQPQDCLDGEHRQRLLQVAESAARELARLVEEGPQEVRRSAAQSLRLMEALGAPGAPVLVATLGSDNLELRAEAADGLGWIKVADDYVIDALVPLLDDADQETRQRAYGSLGRLGAANPRAAEALAAKLSHPAGEHRRRAAWALAQCGVSGRAAIPALLQALGDADTEVRAAAAAGLAGVTRGSDEGVGPLVEALRDPEHEVRIAAAEALEKLGPHASAAIPALLALYEAATPREEGDDAERRRLYDAQLAAIGAFGEIGKAAIPALLGIVTGPDPHLGDHAAVALADLGNAAEAALAECLRGGVRTRIGAAGGFGELASALARAEHAALPVGSEFDYGTATQRHLETLMRRHALLAEALCMRHMHSLCSAANRWTEGQGAGITLDRFWPIDVIGLSEQHSYIRPEDARCPHASEGATGYALNEAVAWLPLRRITRPGETILFFEAGVDRQNPVGGPGDAVARHDGRVVIGFLDGHVDSVPLETATKLLREPIE